MNDPRWNCIHGRKGGAGCAECAKLATGRLHPESEADRAALAAIPTDSPQRDRVPVRGFADLFRRRAAGEPVLDPTGAVVEIPQPVCPTCEGKGTVTVCVENGTDYERPCPEPTCGTGGGQ